MRQTLGLPQRCRTGLFGVAPSDKEIRRTADVGVSPLRSGSTRALREFSAKIAKRPASAHSSVG